MSGRRVLAMRASWLLLLILLLSALAQPVAASSEPTESVVYSVSNTYMLKNLGPSNVMNLKLTVLLFKDWSEWASQHVLLTSYEPPGVSEDNRAENRTATVVLGDLAVGETKRFTVSQVIRVDAVGCAANENYPGSPPPELSLYMRGVPNLWENDELIASKASELTENEPTIYCKARKIFDFVKGYLTYERQQIEHSALWAYRNKLGDCSEFSNLFIALARAAGIPAKPAISYNYQLEFGTDLSRMGHEFVLIWLPDVDWRPVDPTWGRFDELGHEYLVLLTSDGSGFVQDTKISPPSLSHMWWRHSYPHGQPEPRFEAKLESGRIEREVAVEVELERELETAQSLFYRVKVRNVGKRTVENVRVRLQAGDLMPEREEVLGVLAPGENSLTFEVEKKAGSYTLTAEAIFDSPYGRFLAKAQQPVKIVEPWLTLELLLRFALAATVAVLIAVLARVLIIRGFRRLRRR